MIALVKAAFRASSKTGCWKGTFPELVSASFMMTAGVVVVGAGRGVGVQFENGRRSGVVRG